MSRKRRGGAGGRRGSGRGLKQRLRPSKRRKASSTRWLTRQLSDLYVAEAQRQGLRSRAAFKLIEIDDRFKILKPGQAVVDLGAAPGGWTLVAAERINAAGHRNGPQGRVVGIDVQEMQPVPGAHLMVGDFMAADAPGRLQDALAGPADVVLSDMAAPATGHAATDHLRVTALLEAAFEFACAVLKPGGAFVGKAFKGGSEQELLTRMKHRFESVRHAKPPASRKESAETYVVATGFRR
ncbi:MAG: RlmE family RNA methyltransferase [Rhodospirillales bacterium]|nr:RlmE family RNA methyltransferase [Rhodospirillales bacterium]